MDDRMRFGTEADDAWQKHEQYIRGGFRNVIGDLFVNTGGDDSYDGEMDDVIDDPCQDPPQQHHAEPPPSRPPWINRIVDMDKLMFLLILVISGYSLLLLKSVSRSADSNYFKTQLMAIVLGLVGAWILTLVDYNAMASYW